MRSKFYPTFFDTDIVREEVERVLAQTFDADEQLYCDIAGVDFAFSTSPQNAKAHAILQVLKAYSKNGFRGPSGGGAASAILQAYYLSRSKLQVDVLEKMLRDWKCVP